MPFETHPKQHLHHLHLTHSFKLSESAALYLTEAIRAFALALIGIFLPIYIFEISEGYLWFNGNPTLNGISWVLVYYLIRSFSTISIALIFGSLIFSKINFHRSILISFAALIAIISCWLLAERNIKWLFMASSLTGITIIFYWIPYHIFSIRKLKSRDGHYGKNIGKRDFIVRISNALGPIIGGLIIANYGFSALFILSIILLLVGGLPILMNVTEWKHNDHKMKDIVGEYFLNPKLIKIHMAYFGQGMDALVYMIFWPILLFIVLQDFVKIGSLKTISLIASIIMTLVIGKAIDKKGTKVIHAIGSTINGLLYLPRIVFNTPWVLYAIDIADRLNSPMYGLPMTALSYEKAKKLGTSNFMVYRELALHTSIMVTALIGFLAINIVGSWRWIFLLAAIGSFMVYCMDLDKN